MPQGFQSVFQWQRHDHPRLAEFRRAHALEHVVARADDEFSQMVALCEWTYRQFPWLMAPTCQTEDAVEILRRAAQGHPFYCAHFAIVFVAAATALGWHARPISLRREDHPDRASNHNVAEVWSSQWGKWVAFDPTLKHYIARDGVPLNCYEVGREWVLGGGSQMVFVVGSERKEYRRSDLPVVLAHHKEFGDLTINEPWTGAYACVAYIPTNCFLGEYPDRSMERWDDWPNLLILRGSRHGWRLPAEEMPPYYNPTFKRC